MAVTLLLGLFAPLSLHASSAQAMRRQWVGQLTPTQLRCEYAVDPIGIGVRVPRLSWIDTSTVRGDRQLNYRILADSTPDALHTGPPHLWDSGWVQTDETTQIEYGGPPLRSGQRVYWTVAVTGSQGGAPRWSKPASFEMGLLDKSDWKGQWIGLAYKPGDRRPATYLSRTFSVDSPVVQARIYATAKGLYRLFLDGRRVGSDNLTPGWTDYRKRIQYQTYDVTPNLKQGRHRLTMILGDGWYCGHVGLTGGDNYGTRPMGLLQLQADDRVLVATDEHWTATTGPIQSDDLLMGESFDARYFIPGFAEPEMVHRRSTPATDRSSNPKPSLLPSPEFFIPYEGAVDTEPIGDLPIVAQSDPTVQVLDELKPKKMWRTAGGAVVYDLGQNMVGYARLKVSGPAGTTVRLRFAEMLNPDRTIYTTNLRGAKATDYYTLSGKGVETWEPMFTFHGFRYVELSGYPGKPGMDAVTGVVIGSNNPQAGTFTCNDKLVDQLQHNIFWGERGNYLSIPTDCPQRDERLGWMGDAEVFAPTATYNNDVAAFLSKFTQDTVDAQSAEGGFSDVSPRMGDQSDGAPAWGDAGVIVPWTIYEYYGDKRILAERYEAMRKWVEYIDSVNPDHIWINRSNNNFGDWLNVHDDTPRDVIATAYFERSTDLVARAARVLGKLEDAGKYEALRDAIRQAFVAHFVRDDVLIKGDTQTDYVLALAFDLLPESMRNRAADRLNHHIVVDRKTHLSTGFVGVGELCPVLTQYGYVPTAYKLLENDTYPSWGYSIRQGATTIWERWDGWTQDHGFQDPGMNSFNHYSLGSVGRWMFETVAGIAPDPTSPGYKRIIVHPIADSKIRSAEASLMTMHGLIRTEWKLTGSHFDLVLTVPANTVARVYMPEQLTSEPTVPFTQEGGRSTSGRTDIKFLGLDGGNELFEVGGGTYHFTSDFNLQG